MTSFWDNVEKSDGCWRWLGAPSVGGYGRATIDGRRDWAHRHSYRLAVGQFDETLTIDHLCHNQDSRCRGGRKCPHRLCVNPDHLEPVSAAINSSRGGRRLTHCKRGHALDELNTRIYRGQRHCRRCKALLNNGYYHRAKHPNVPLCVVKNGIEEWQ